MMWITLALALALLAFSPGLAALLLSVASVWAATQGVITIWLAAGVIIVCGGAIMVPPRVTDRLPGWLREGLMLALAVALMLHLVPGFTNPKRLDAVAPGPLSVAFTLYYNFDKALVPFVLRIGFPRLFRGFTPETVGRWRWIALIAAIPVLLLLATAAGGLRFEWHHPAWFWQFALANLFFVSLAEEALFRGYMQQRLQSLFSPCASLLIAALIFGLLHHPGGPLLMVFATLAGVVYGLAWQWSGRLWVATGFHFALNVTHLLLFTYPVWKDSAGN